MAGLAIKAILWQNIYKWNLYVQIMMSQYVPYGADGSIMEFTYVNTEKVYRTTDGGKTWYDITPESGA